MTQKQAQENQTNEKILAIAEFMQLDSEELGEITEGYNENIFEVQGEEWLVLTDEEADVAVYENIEDSLWAFNPSFLSYFMDLPEDVIKKMQESLYEDASPAFRKLVGDKFDDLVRDAVMSDTRGHFLSGYDGAEHEENVGGNYYYLYRLN